MKEQETCNCDPWADLRVKDIERLPLEEVYSVNETLVVFFAPRFRLFVECVEGCGATPLGLEWEEWHGILKKIQFAFDTMEHKTYDACISADEFTEEEVARINEGLALLGKWFFHLWY